MLTVHLKSHGNPDHGQFAPISNRETVEVNTPEEARAACLKYIEQWNLGGGNWSGGIVRKNGKRIAKVSYNGRVWDNSDKEIVLKS